MMILAHILWIWFYRRLKSVPNIAPNNAGRAIFTYRGKVKHLRGMNTTI